MIINDCYDGPINVASVEEVINNPDIFDEVLTFYREDTTPFSIKKLLNRATKNIPTKNINTNSIYELFQKKNYDSKLLQGRPTILSISIGKASQQYQIETLINRCLKHMNFSFYQSFSPETRFILKNQNFNDSCLNFCEDYTSDYDLFVGGLSVSSINELYNEGSIVCGLIRKMSPDVVVINCNATQSYIDTNILPAIEVFKYRYNINRIIVVISEYYFNSSLNVSIKVPVKPKIRENVCFYLSDFNKKTEGEFFNQILSTVYIPDGIYPI